MKINIKNKKFFPYRMKRFERGFSIGEVMLSTVILGMSLVAVAGLMSTSIRHSADSRNQIIASELAQEGVELVRNIRDNNIASGLPSFTNFGTVPAYNCQIDKNYSTGTAMDCDASNTFQLFYNNNFYSHSGSGGTKFYREIILDAYLSSGRKVISVVKWNGTMLGVNVTPNSANCNAGLKCIYVEEILMDR